MDAAAGSEVYVAVPNLASLAGAEAGWNGLLLAAVSLLSAGSGPGLGKQLLKILQVRYLPKAELTRLVAGPQEIQ